MQICLLFIGVSKELLDEFFGKAEPLYFSYRKNTDLLLVSRETLTHLQILTCKERQKSSIQKFRKSSQIQIQDVRFNNLKKTFQSHWLKGFPHSRRGMKGQTWVPHEYHSLLFPCSSNKPRLPREVQTLPDISFHRTHSWSSWADWLFCGHYKCRCI